MSSRHDQVLLSGVLHGGYSRMSTFAKTLRFAEVPRSAWRQCLSQPLVQSESHESQSLVQFCFTALRCRVRRA